MAASIRTVINHQIRKIITETSYKQCKRFNRGLHIPWNMSVIVDRSMCDIHRRHHYTYRFFRGRYALDTTEKCKDFAASLFPNERALVLVELQRLQLMYHNESKIETTQPPTKEQLRFVALSNGIPFIGFGFLDNAIMIVAGDYIDLTIGVTLGISTMAAAAFGNLVSDLAGVGLAGYVEALAAKVGVQPKGLTPEQANLRKTRSTAGLGRALGLTIGCILGMFPLLFLETRREEASPDGLEDKEGQT